MIFLDEKYNDDILRLTKLGFVFKFGYTNKHRAFFIRIVDIEGKFFNEDYMIQVSDDFIKRDVNDLTYNFSNHLHYFIDLCKKRDIL